MLELSFYNPLKIFLANKALYLNRIFFLCFLNKKIHKHLSNIDGPKDKKRSWFFSLTNFSEMVAHFIIFRTSEPISQ